jgi:ferredoxin
MAMKVFVDHDQCDGYGKCQEAAPDVFELRNDDLSYVIVDDVPEGSIEAARLAIRNCPKLAISEVTSPAA